MNLVRKCRLAIWSWLPDVLHVVHCPFGINSFTFQYSSLGLIVRVIEYTSQESFVVRMSDTYETLDERRYDCIYSGRLWTKDRIIFYLNKLLSIKGDKEITICHFHNHLQMAFYRQANIGTTGSREDHRMDKNKSITYGWTTSHHRDWTRNLKYVFVQFDVKGIVHKHNRHNELRKNYIRRFIHSDFRISDLLNWRRMVCLWFHLNFDSKKILDLSVFKASLKVAIKLPNTNTEDVRSEYHVLPS